MGGRHPQYFALRHRSQRLDHRKLLFRIRRLIDKAHYHLHHLGRSLFQLPMFLREKQDLLIEQAPIP